MLDIDFDNSQRSPQPDQSRDILNLAVTTSLAASAATISLRTKAGNAPSPSDPCKIGFVDTTVNTGFAKVSAIAATSITIPSGASLGHQNGTDNYLYVWAINNAGTVELAVSGAYVFENQSVQSTTAITAGSTSPHVLYSTSARSSKSIRLICRIKSNQATAGTWVTTFSEVQIEPIRIWPLIAVISDQKANSTAGGTFTSGAYQTRTLNTKSDPDLIITSLSSNQFVLPAGSYQIIASAAGNKVNRHRTRLFNITDAATVIQGTNNFGDQAVGDGNRSFTMGAFAITASKTFEFQHRCQTTKATNGFGEPTTTGGEVEVYAIVEITRLK